MERGAEKARYSPQRHRVLGVILCVLCVSLVALPGLPAVAAGRVASLNLCTDQMLVLLAPEKIAALTPLSRDPALSFVASRAEHLPYGAQTTLTLLQQERLPILRIALAQDFAGIRRMTRLLAATLGVPERGEALIAAMDHELETLPHPSHAVRALVLEPRGLTAGPGTLMDAVLRAAGMANASDGRRVSLEALVSQPPDLLIVPSPPAYPSLATVVLRHPALANLPRRSIPPALTICAGPFSAAAAAMLTR